jgi:hypothetical protein
VGWLVLITLLTIAGHVLLAAGRAQQQPRPLPVTAGDTVAGVWCVPCNAPVAVRVPLRHGDDGTPPTAWLTVCAMCGTRHMPSVPAVTIAQAPRRRPRPWLAVQWRAHRRDCARRGTRPVACALGDCPRPGWADCAWYEAVDDGRIRWMFCGRKHRREWLATRGHTAD